ncbi:MAG: tRNA (adenosine(37)-N6)-threonylcarbamoyltransferase complex dimerization subunit type 1 TsaB [Aestuariivirga sp.]
MLILAIDTCLARCAVCLFDSAVGIALAEEHLDMERGHAEALAPMVQRVLVKAQKQAKDLQRIAVTTGPGSFTGVRIGLSFARAMGLARNIPVCGLDTLHAFRLTAVQETLAMPSGNSGLAFVLRGVGEIELIPMSEVDPAAFVKGTPDLKALSIWAAKQAAPLAMPEPVYIREADAKPLVSVKFVDASSSAIVSHIHHTAFDIGWSEKDITEMLSTAGTEIALAEIAGEAVGFAMIRSIMDQAELLTIATLPAHRRKNAAATVLKHAFTKAQSLGATSLFLEVAQSNSSAHRLYVKLGFTETGRRKAYYVNGDDAIVMARSLA